MQKKFTIYQGISLAILFLFVFPTPLSGAMSSENYQVIGDSFAFGGSMATSANYGISDSGGEPGAGSTTSTNYQIIFGSQAVASPNTLTVTLSKTSINLGTLSTAAVASDSHVVSVITNSPTGYTVRLYEDGNLRSGSDDIDDVADGSVSAGAEEYGIGTSGTDGQYNSADAALSTSLLTVATRNASAPTAVGTTITYKAGVSQATKFGSYTHTVTMVTTSNF